MTSSYCSPKTFCAKTQEDGCFVKFDTIALAFRSIRYLNREKKKRITFLHLLVQISRHTNNFTK